MLASIVKVMFETISGLVLGRQREREKRSIGSVSNNNNFGLSDKQFPLNWLERRVSMIVVAVAVPYYFEIKLCWFVCLFFFYFRVYYIWYTRNQTKAKCILRFASCCCRTKLDYMGRCLYLLNCVVEFIYSNYYTDHQLFRRRHAHTRTHTLNERNIPRYRHPDKTG